MGGLSLFLAQAAAAQAIAYTDPAQAFNKMVLDKSTSASFERIGSFKVIGTPFLYGDRNPATVYAKEGTVSGILASYNTYAQQLEVYQSNDDQKRLIKDAKTVDSFDLQPRGKMQMHFVSAAHLGSSKVKGFLLLVSDGPSYQLYKRYTSDLGIVTSNYIDASLRQYDLDYEFYYLDRKTRSLKKIRLTAYDVQKEFKDKIDLSGMLGNSSLPSDPEGTLKMIITQLNMQ